MEFRVLGKVEIRGERAVVAPGRSAERCVLAVLAVSAGHPVSVDRLVEAIWADDPPAKADETVATHVRSVRRLIEQAGGSRDRLRNRRPRAYQLDVDPAAVDCLRFADLVSAARAIAATGDHRAAVDAYARAVELWRGEPLADLHTPWADRRRLALHADYREASCGLLNEQLQLRAYAAVAAGAQRLLSEVVPTDQLITLGLHGLHGCGERAAIPSFLERAGELMWASAGVRPSPRTRALALRLTAEPEPAGEVAEMVKRTAGTPPIAPAPPAADSASTAQAPPAAESAAAVLPAAGVVLIASSNSGPVFQAARDQHIT